MHDACFFFSAWGQIKGKEDTEEQTDEDEEDTASLTPLDRRRRLIGLPKSLKLIC